MNKKIYYLLFSWVFFFQSSLSQSEEEASKIVLVTRPLKSKIMLRWSVNNAFAWRDANKYGYILEKTLISRDNKPVLPIEKVTVENKVFKPAPLADWKIPFDKDPNAAVIAQALYGDSFEVVNSDPIASVVAINREIEHRFIFALIAAEQSFEYAVLAGWGYVDENVAPNEKYIYTVKINNPAGKSIAKEINQFTSVDFYEPLPKPQELIGFFKENLAELNWDYGIMKNVYTSYNVERSLDGESFKKINKYPIFNAEKIKANKPISLSYSDSIPNGKVFYYRIKGINSFGQEGPPSNVFKGKALKKLKYVPVITSKKIRNDTQVQIDWEIDKASQNLLQGFELMRSNNGFSDFKTVVKQIPPNARTVTYDKLKKTNYFKIVALSKNGDRRPSHPTLVQPVDSIPPMPPVDLVATMDTLGIARIKWKPNQEDDLEGYKVFRSNSLDTEFTQAHTTLLKESNFIDTLPIKNLNKKIYYKILAEDQRYNASSFSEVLTIEKPDVVPPSPPVISNYKASDNKVKINFIPSSSSDVVSHNLYREDTSLGNSWVLVQSIPTDAESLIFTDKNGAPGNYRYTVIATDITGNESTPALPIEVKIKEKLGVKVISKFEVISDRVQRIIILNWKVSNNQIAEFLLYRAEKDTQYSLYKTFDKNQKRFTDINLKVNSTYRYALRAILLNGVESSLETVQINY